MQAAPVPVPVPVPALTRKSRPPSLPTARMSGLLIGAAAVGEEEAKDEMPSAAVGARAAAAAQEQAEAEAPWERVPTPTSFAVPLPSPSPASPYQLPSALKLAPNDNGGLSAKQPPPQQQQQAGGGATTARGEGTIGAEERADGMA